MPAGWICKMGYLCGPRSVLARPTGVPENRLRLLLFLGLSECEGRAELGTRACWRQRQPGLERGRRRRGGACESRCCREAWKAARVRRWRPGRGAWARFRAARGWGSGSSGGSAASRAQGWGGAPRSRDRCRPMGRSRDARQRLRWGGGTRWRRVPERWLRPRGRNGQVCLWGRSALPPLPPREDGKMTQGGKKKKRAVNRSIMLAKKIIIKDGGTVRPGGAGGRREGGSWREVPARGGPRAPSCGRSRRAAGRRPAQLSVCAALPPVRPRREERPWVERSGRFQGRRANRVVSGAGSSCDTCGCPTARLSRARARNPSGSGGRHADVPSRVVLWGNSRSTAGAPGQRVPGVRCLSSYGLPFGWCAGLYSGASLYEPVKDFGS